jgi:hypothetical protein
MFQDNEIEIAIDVKIEAGVGFRVDRETWAKASDSEKRAMIFNVIDGASMMFANDVLPLPQGHCAFLSAEVAVPLVDEIDLSETRLYDSKEG